MPSETSHQRPHQVHPRPPRIARLHQPRVHVDVARAVRRQDRVQGQRSVPVELLPQPRQVPRAAPGATSSASSTTRRRPPRARAGSRARPPGGRSRRSPAPSPAARPAAPAGPPGRRRSRARRRGATARSATSRTPWLAVPIGAFANTGKRFQAATSTVTVDAGCGSPSSSSTRSCATLSCTRSRLSNDGTATGVGRRAASRARIVTCSWVGSSTSKPPPRARERSVEPRPPDRSPERRHPVHPAHVAREAAEPEPRRRHDLHHVAGGRQLRRRPVAR